MFVLFLLPVVQNQRSSAQVNPTLQPTVPGLFPRPLFVDEGLLVLWQFELFVPLEKS